MCSIPPRRQATLALRIAGGLGPFAAARAAGIDESDVRDLLHVASFQEMVGSWTQILAMDPTARRQRLELLAQLVIEAKLADADFRTALLVQRAQARNRDIVASLARGFERQALRDRAAARPEPAPPPMLTSTPTSAPLPPVVAAVAEAEAARRLAKRPDPVDRMLWCKAGELRREMFDEQLLDHAGEAPAAGPVAVEPAAEPAPPAAAPAAAPAAGNRADRRRLAKLAKAGGHGRKPGRLDPGRLDPGLLARLRQKFAALPPSSLALMLERAPPDLAPYFTVLAREARQGKLWPKGP